MKIGIFDSGKGGILIMQHIKALLPDEEYKYIADTKNCPYGNKTARELREIVIKIVDELIDWGAEIIVVACNTATVKCIDYLREKYPTVDFIGTEPAVKVAAEIDEAENIMVLATPGTIRSERLERVIAENRKPYQTFTLVSCKGLAEVIEKNMDFHEDFTTKATTEGTYEIYTTFCNIINDAHISQYQAEPDLIVLGCTHYSLAEPIFRVVFKDAIFIDGNSGVAHRTLDFVNLRKSEKNML